MKNAVNLIDELCTLIPEHDALLLKVKHKLQSENKVDEPTHLYLKTGSLFKIENGQLYKFGFWNEKGEEIWKYDRSELDSSFEQVYAFEAEQIYDSMRELWKYLYWR